LTADPSGRARYGDLAACIHDDFPSLDSVDHCY
jgi:hypothetical protein